MIQFQTKGQVHAHCALLKDILGFVVNKRPTRGPLSCVLVIYNEITHLYILGRNAWGVKSSKFIFHIGSHFFLCISQLMTNFNNQYLCSIATNKPDVKHMEISMTKEQSYQVSFSILVKMS